MALHWGWPYDVAEHGGNSHSRGTVADTYEKTKRSFERFRHLNGGAAKPMTMAERSGWTEKNFAITVQK